MIGEMSEVMDDVANRFFEGDEKGEFPFDPTHYVFHLMVALTRTRDAQLERDLRAIGSNLSKHRAMTVIVRFGPCTMSELADYSVVDRTTLTRTVDQLVSEGLVERKGAPNDRRRVLLTMTEKGHDAAARARVVAARHNVEALKGVPEELVRSMIRGQQMVIANLADDEMAHRLLTLTRPEATAAND